MDEVWVPTTFHVGTFSSSGVEPHRYPPSPVTSLPPRLASCFRQMKPTTITTALPGSRWSRKPWTRTCLTPGDTTPCHSP